MRSNKIVTNQPTPMHVHNPGRMLSRRGFLQIATLGAAPFAVPNFLRSAKAADMEESTYIRSLRPDGRDSGKSLLFIVMQGGQPHFDTFDPKVTSPLGRIKTATPGVYFGTHLPRLAKETPNMRVYRNIFQTDGDHGRATALFFTGRPESISNSQHTDATHPSPFTDFTQHLVTNGSPDTGYVVMYYNQPTWRAPWGSPFAGLQFHDANALYVPWSTSEYRNPFSADLDLPRYRERRELLRQVDGGPNKPTGPAIDRADAVQALADSKLDGPLRHAFDVEREPLSVREEYGMNPFGTQLLVARRLLESGVRVVGATHGDYDLHHGIQTFLPPLLSVFDQAMSALMNDLTKRGLRNKVLVAIVSEFGRTPNLTGHGAAETLRWGLGREHWTQSMTMVLWGAGVRGGDVVGKTREEGTIQGDAINANILGESLFRKGTGHGRYYKRGEVLTDRTVPNIEL